MTKTAFQPWRIKRGAAAAAAVAYQQASVKGIKIWRKSEAAAKRRKNSGGEKSGK